MTRRLRLLAMPLFALLLVVASTGSATAEDRPDGEQLTTEAIELSLDGITWSDRLTTPLFDPDVRWVPGDVRTAQFFVRNSMPDLGDLSVVLERPLTRALLDSGFLSIAARAGSGPWSLIRAGDRRVLIDDAELDSRDDVVVQLRAMMDADAPNRTMVLATDLDLQIRLSQGGVVADATSDDDREGFDPFGGPNGPNEPGGVVESASGSTDGSGSLPDTGSSLRPWMLPLALLLLAAGAVLLARRRVDDEVEERPCADLEIPLAQP